MNETSVTQKKYLSSLKKHKYIVNFSRFLIFFLFIGLWEITTRLGVLDSFIFSSPSKVMLCFYQMMSDKTLLPHIGITLLETTISFVLVILISLIVSILLWFNRKLSETLEPYLVLLNSLPKSALAPLLIVWLGANYRTIIVTGMSVAIFGSILSLYTSFQAADPEKMKLIYSLGGKKYHIMTKVILPSNIPTLFSLMRVNIGLCLVGVIIGEFIAARSGLGYLIIYGSQVFRWGYVLILCGILLKTEEDTCFVVSSLYNIHI